MLYRILSLILIITLPVSQGKGYGHSHRGTWVAEPPKHDARPHIHVGGAGHHHHHHQESGHSHKGDDKHEKARPAKSLDSSSDHDDDAVYFPTSVTLAVGRHLSADLIAKLVVGALCIWSA